MPDTPVPDPAAQTNNGDMSIFGPRHVTRLMVAIVVVICCVIFSYGGRWVHWPSEPRYQGSLAQLPMSLGAFLVALALLVVCTVLGTLVLSRRYFLAGLMAATAGLTTWAVRGGTSTYVLFNAHNSGAGHQVFLKLLGELVVLFAVIGALWNAIWVTQSAAAEKARMGANRTANMGDRAAQVAVHRMFGILGFLVWEGASAMKGDKDKGRSTLMALIAQAAVMAVVVLLLVATPQKKQVLVGVFIAGVASTAIAETVFADRNTARWYWIGPLAAGVFGYIAAFLFPAGLEQGDLTGMFGQMAHVLPLDYASIGCAGTLLGYWWMMPDDDGDEKTEAPAPAK